MGKRIVFKKQDNTVSIISPAPKAMIEHGFKTEDEHIDYLVKRLVPEGAEFHIVEEKELPPSRKFRNAWTLKNKKIVVDREKAKEMKKDELEKLRLEKIKELNLMMEECEDFDDQVKAIECKNKRINLRKQNISSLIEGLSVDDMEKFTPDW